MAFGRLKLFSLFLSIMLACPTWADDFPGKGNRAAWSDALPYYNLANKYLSHDRIDEAVQNYEEAIYRYEYDPDFYLNYGVALRKRENYTGAETAFKKAIELKENDWQAWSNLANAYLKQNRLKDTIATFQRAMKCKPAPPQSEKEAMLKDIADINKILSMQEPAKKTQAAAAKPAGAATKISTAPSSRKLVPGAVGKTKTTALPAVAQPDEKTELKKSGWDWVN